MRYVTKSAYETAVEHVDWRDEAACRGYESDLFYPTSETAHDLIAEAKAVCATCPVRDTCLADALDRREPHGIWGGQTPSDRGFRDGRWRR